MSPIDALPAIRIVAVALGDLLQDVMFVGGAITGLLVTDPAASASRLTDDVDVVIDVCTYPDYVKLIDRLRRLGFAEDASEGTHRFRWVIAGVRVDVMPTSPDLGPANRWYSEAIANTQIVAIDAELLVRVISAPYFIATKLDAFGDGHRGDYLSSHDLEDIIAIVDGRATIESDVSTAPALVRDFLRDRFRSLLADPGFVEAVAGHLLSDSASQARLPLVLSRMRAIAGTD